MPTRADTVDPRHHVMLEASAGTGKTSVLVARYVNLLKASVDHFAHSRYAPRQPPRCATASSASSSARPNTQLDKRRWLERDRIGEIAIGTIDAFCLSLLREFPLEADVDPGFELADETEVPRLVSTALDRALRIIVNLARGCRRCLAWRSSGWPGTPKVSHALLDRRLVARRAEPIPRAGPRPDHRVCLPGCRPVAARHAADDPGRARRVHCRWSWHHPRYHLLVREIRQLPALHEAPEATIRAVLDRVSGHFLTNEGTARKPASAIYPYTKADHYANKDAMKRHRDAVFAIAPRIRTSCSLSTATSTW